MAGERHGHGMLCVNRPLYTSNIKETQRIRTMMFDDVSDDDSIDDGAECHGGYVEPTESDSESAEATSDDYCCTGSNWPLFSLERTRRSGAR